MLSQCDIKIPFQEFILREENQNDKTKIYQQHKNPAKQPDLCFQLAPLGGSCTAVGRRERLVAGDIVDGPWQWRLMRKAETD